MQTFVLLTSAFGASMRGRHLPPPKIVERSTNAQMDISMKTNIVQMDYYSTNQPTGAIGRKMSTAENVLMEFIHMKQNVMLITNALMATDIQINIVQMDYCSILNFLFVIGQKMFSVKWERLQ